MSKTTPATDPTDSTAPGAPAADQDLGAAGAQLSTAPRDSLSVPALGVVGWARWFWRQLTSMRVALLLLLLVALGAIPGSLIPQTGTDATKVADFVKNNPTLADVYDKLGLFHVYSSVWFGAIYILLFVSLIGCIIPRTWQFVGQLRGRPPGAPKRLTRLPAYTTWRTEAEPEQVREAALALLKKRRFRADLAGDAVAAEKGYLREVGNLAFHIALIVMLTAFAWGQLFKSEGNKLVVEGDGDGFSNTLISYDDFKSGNLFDVDDLVPFSFTLDKFTGTYETSGPTKGTPRLFQAAITYSEGAYGKSRKTLVKVNEPLEIGDAKVYLTAHGYAPVVTVRDGKGDVVYSDAVPMLPLDSNVTSTGVVKVLDGYKNAKGVSEQLGISAFFLPTYTKGSETASTFPALNNPVLNLTPYHGDLGVNSGIPQSVYQLDKSHMKDFKDAKGQELRENLKPGQTMRLPGGAGSVTYEGTKQWANFQVVQQPASGWALAGALTAIFGLAASLFIQRRRVWVRAVRGGDGVTVVEMAGLGRSESAKLPEELGELAGVLFDQAPGAPDRDAASDEPPAPTGPAPGTGKERTEPVAGAATDAQHPAKPPVADPDTEPRTEQTTPDPQVAPSEGAETQ
ncbi:cytochrome c biogenesis protein ResB [Streptomyces sp. NPDC058307]|uniref:cytochrome c biogenesis protein ResB n=1 Tax=Streptomyces sp. NPDC058307 TaxID=3346439 RepID=UPI0036E8D9C7